MDFTRGLLQSIGFKEFNAYLQLPLEDRYTESGEKLFNDGIELLKIATRQYARRQIKWINQRFFRPTRRQVPPVYWLNGTYSDAVTWEKNVTVPAFSLLESHLSNNLDHPLVVARRVGVSEGDDDLIARACDVCDNRVLVGNLQWNAHVNGSRHKKMIKRKKAMLLDLTVITNKNADNFKAAE